MLVPCGHLCLCVGCAHLLQAQKKEVERYGNIYEDLKRELDIVQASAGAV